MSTKTELKNYATGYFDYLRYVKHVRKSPTPPLQLCMLMQFKDESDIIELNIRYHALKGVKAFFLVDNGSTDGSREIVEKLKSEYEIYLFEDTGLDYRQSVNMTMLARKARQKNYDWAIPNDADEFWYTEGLLTDCIDRLETVQRVKRINVVPIYQKKEQWVHSPYVTLNAIKYHKDELSNNSFNILFEEVLHKSWVNLHGLIRIAQGNHRARNVIDKLKGRRFSSWNRRVTIYHYGVRSYQQFEKKVKNIHASITHIPKK